MYHLFVINPAAGRRESTTRMEQLLDEVSFAHKVVYTTGEGDAQRITKLAAAVGEPVRIYACGGDGTLNEVVNGAAGQDHVAVTCVPKGTGNDFLRIFGPDYHTLFYNLEALAVGPQTAMDLIDCNGKLGLGVVCAGLDARIAAGVHRYKNWPLVSGRWAYRLSLIENVLLRGIAQPMDIRIGERDWSGETTLVCICNGRYYGGGFMPVPEAMPDDEMLNILLIPKVSLLTLTQLVGEYAKGRYGEYPQLIQACHGTAVTYASQQEIVTVVDGEVMRNTAFTVRLSERKVNFFYPAGADYGPPR